MKSIETTGRASFSKDRKRAQVIVLVGKGRNQRSVTRHVVRENGGWIGLNPDERAVPLNKRYEDELVEAKADLDSEQARLIQLRKKLEGLKAETPEDIMAVEMRKEMLMELEEAITESQATLDFAQASFEDAKLKLDIIRRELPLEIEFVGPGLT